jgi:hypothetical protein
MVEVSLRICFNKQTRTYMVSMMCSDALDTDGRGKFAHLF